MTTMNMKDFLQGFSAKELRERDILITARNILQGVSVKPLIGLMRNSGIQKLEYQPIGWSLDTDYNFSNRFSPELKKGKVQDLKKPGSVFTKTNRDINPHYRGQSLASNIEEEIEEAGEITVGLERDLQAMLREAGEITVGLERDLQAMLRQRIQDLEPGLTITDTGKERTVEAGRIDITAKDKEGKAVVVELKAGIAKSDSIAQILAYMSCLGEKENGGVRGILVAGDFDERTVLAARMVPNLKLKQCSVNFSFKDR